MSGRRAAENTNTTPNDADVRLVPMSREQRDDWMSVAEIMDEQGHHDIADRLRDAAIAWDAAPDPTEAATTGAHNDARCIWLTEEFFEGFTSELDASQSLDWLLFQFRKAPADPVGIAADTLRAQGLHRDHDLQAAAAVLVALGLRRQDNPTP